MNIVRRIGYLEHQHAGRERGRAAWQRYQSDDAGQREKERQIERVIAQNPDDVIPLFGRLLEPAVEFKDRSDRQLTAPKLRAVCRAAVPAFSFA